MEEYLLPWKYILPCPCGTIRVVFAHMKGGLACPKFDNTHKECNFATEVFPNALFAGNHDFTVYWCHVGYKTRLFLRFTPAIPKKVVFRSLYLKIFYYVLTGNLFRLGRTVRCFKITLFPAVPITAQFLLRLSVFCIVAITFESYPENASGAGGGFMFSHWIG